MTIEVALPELGEKIESATVAAVLVAAGDRVSKDQALLEVETDKATAELPAPSDGVVVAVQVVPGDEVRVGQVVMILSANGAAATESTSPPADAPASVSVQAPESAPESVPESAPEFVPESAPESAPESVAGAKPEISTGFGPGPEPERGPTSAPIPVLDGASSAAASDQALAPAGPAARRLARELGLAITAVPGTGPRGRISIADVKAAAKRVVQAAGPAGDAPGAPAPDLPDFSRWGEIDRQPLTAIRRATATAMANAWAVVPHVTQADRADITELDEGRRAWTGGETKLTVTAVILKAVASALKHFPAVNGSLDLERREMIFKRYVHLGVAVDTEHGLLVPVVRNADQKNAITIAAELSDLAAQARERKLSLDQMQGATFTITNLGGLGTTYFSPIVSWPQVAILGVGRATREPVWRGGQFEPRLILPLSLSYDHRAIDGADAARFLRWVAEALERPLRLVVEG